MLDLPGRFGSAARGDFASRASFVSRLWPASLRKPSANAKVLAVCRACSRAGEEEQFSTTWHKNSPSNTSRKITVRGDSRNGTGICLPLVRFVFSLRALITRPREIRLLLISMASFTPSPLTPVETVFSDPARSTS